MKTNKNFIHISLLLILLPRALLFYFGNSSDTITTPDSKDYIELSQNLSQFGEYNNIDGQPEFFRPPGYPYFLSLTGTNNLLTPIIFQWGFDIAAFFLIVLIVERRLGLNNRLIKIVLIIGYCLSTLTLTYSTKILSDSIFSTLIITSVFLITRKCDHPNQNLISSILLGITFFLLLTFKSISTIIAPALLIWHYFTQRNIKSTLIIIAITLTLSAPWLHRNHKLGLNAFSTNPNITLYRYHAAAFTAHQTGTTFKSTQDEFDKELEKHPDQLSKNIYAETVWKNIVFNNVFQYTAFHLSKLYANFLPIEGEMARMAGFDVGNNGSLKILVSDGLLSAIKHYFKSNTWLAIALSPLVLILIIKYILVLFFLFHAIRHKISLHFYIPLLALGILLILPTGPDSHPRFRLPIEFIIIILSTNGFMTVFEKFICAESPE